MYPEEMKLDQLTKSFVKHNLSAAGVSYIFKSKSSIRRWAWFVMVAICMIFMAYMTANVILEYLSFPKMNIKEDVILPHLPFPAVTLCPLNPITARNVSPSLKRFTKLSRMLKNAIVKKRNKPLRNKCHKDPLCQWSWFKETCNCIKNPCLSEYCLAENSTHCGCSNIFCGAKKHQSCREVPLLSRNGRSCVCVGESAINQAITKHNQVDPKTQDLLESVDDKEVREVISLIKDSRSFDLIDVEEAFMPSTEELYNYSIPFNGFVSSCSFEGKSCYQENFTVLFHPNYGVCYMFNFVGNEQPGSEVPVNTYSYGSGSGLQLLLRVDDRFVLDLLRREIGARIVIHDPHSLPFVSEYGINIRPHDMTVIELSLSKTEKLDKPWGDCKRERYLHSNDGPYSVLGCEKGCAMKHMTSLCNCTMRYLLRGTVLSSRPPPFPLCNMSHDAHRDCLYKSINDISSSSKACKCKPPCSETRYRISVAASELNENYFRTVKAVHTLQLDEDGNLTYVNNTDSKAMLGVKIYYNTFMVTIDKEIASYSWQTLISNIGGNLGFFMGLTLVTFFEITEFLWDVMRVAFGRFATPKVDDFRGPKTPSSKSRAAQRTMKRLYYRNQLKKNVLQRKKQWL